MNVSSGNHQAEARALHRETNCDSCFGFEGANARTLARNQRRVQRCTHTSSKQSLRLLVDVAHSQSKSREDLTLSLAHPTARALFFVIKSNRVQQAVHDVESDLCAH